MIVRPATITNGNLGLDGPSYCSPSSHPRGHLYSGFPEAVKADQSLRQVDINYMNCHNAIMASVPVFLANTPVVRIGS
jgi:hypothetical protein